MALRPEFSEVGELHVRALVPSVSVMALTASAMYERE